MAQVDEDGDGEVDADEFFEWCVERLELICQECLPSTTICQLFS